MCTCAVNIGITTTICYVNTVIATTNKRPIKAPLAVPTFVQSAAGDRFPRRVPINGRNIIKQWLNCFIYSTNTTFVHISLYKFPGMLVVLPSVQFI